MTLVVYVHWPFCLSKCPYCDFNSYVLRKNFGSIDDFCEIFFCCILQELAYVRHLIPVDQTVSSIFFGGGTPSLMPPVLVGRLIEAVRLYWPLAGNAEITLEANPTSIEMDKFSQYKEAGINRLSIGIQSLDDKELAFLGRTHTAREALIALECAQRIFHNVSADFIYALPEQDLLKWQAKLKNILSLQLDHLSLYQLTIEKSTRFYKMYHQKQAFCLPCNDVSADLYCLTHELCSGYNFNMYEISNYAKSKKECWHNQMYWRYNSYVGVGPGAHGRLHLANNSVIATQTIKNPYKWVSSFEDNHRHAFIMQEVLSFRSVAQEMIMMSLRTVEGLDINYFLSKTCKALYTKGIVQELVKEGFLFWRTKSFLAPTFKGLLVANSVIQKVINDQDMVFF